MIIYTVILCVFYFNIRKLIKRLFMTEGECFETIVLFN